MAEVNERAILATVITNPAHAAHAFTRVPVTEFTGPHALVAEAIHHLRVDGKPIDQTTVVDEMRRRSTLARVGGMAEVFRLAQEYVPAASLDYHLDIVADEIRLRRLGLIGARISQQVAEADADSVSIAQAAAEAIQAVRDAAEAETEVTTESLRDFLSGEDEPYDWVIPGLLERGDRMMLTGSEGLGKSTLFRQIAVGASAGVHPFTHARIAPQRVLYVDVENSRKKLRRSLRPLAIAARQAGGEACWDNLYLEVRPQGLDLTKPADEAWLVSRVAALQPAILVTGPAYRLHEDDPNKEEPARKVTVALDRCRAVANCALVLEAHSGHQTDGMGRRIVRPFGTSLWLRWPEFGYGIRPAEDFTKDNRLVEFAAWRGDRDERDWPSRLRAGGSWPWQVATDPLNHWTPTTYERPAS